MLRRSGFKRPELERPPRSPLHPLERCGIVRQVGDTVVACPKEVILRSRPYRMWVATTWPCDICGIAGFGQAAHENLGKAMQGKVCDTRIFNGCGAHWGLIGCHAQFDLALDGLTRDERRELGARLSAQMRERAKVAGWRFEPEGIIRP